MRRHVTVLLTLCGVALLPASTAEGQGCDAPPGTAAIEQYCEVVPSAGGSGKGRNRAGGGDGGERSARAQGSYSSSDAAARDGSPGGVPAATRRALEGEGTAGRSVAQLAGGSASSSDSEASATRGGGGDPADDGTATSTGGSGTGSPPVEAAPERSSNPLDAITTAASKGATSSPALPWILLVSGLAVLGAAWLRFRGGGSSSDPSTGATG